MVNSNITRPRLEMIEALRALAAFIILILHMVAFSGMKLPSYLNIIHTHFRLGVPLFYTLSGFVLAYTYLNKLQTHSQIVCFYIRRFFRIAPLFYFMLIITPALLPSYAPTSLRDILLNIGMIFGLIPGKQLSLVIAGWSIGVEILFYLIFPLFAIFTNSVRSGIIAWLIIMFISSCFLSATSPLTSVSNTMLAGTDTYLSILSQLPHFLSGIVAYLIWEKTGFLQKRTLGIGLLSFTILATTVIVYKESLILSLSSNGLRLELYIWSLLFMILILSLCFWPVKYLVNRITTNLGKISFSLYLTHPVIMLLLSNVYINISKFIHSELGNFIICAVITMFSVTLISNITFKLIELPGMQYGKWLSNKFSNQSNAPWFNDAKPNLA